MENKYFFIFSGDRLLIREGGNGASKIPFGSECPVVMEGGRTCHNLPLLNGHECKAFDAGEDCVSPDGYKWESLRSSYYVLQADEYAMAGKAHEIIYWDKNTLFCGRCGGQMRLHTDISKVCTQCGKEVWPSLSTAIIVAITRGDELLMVQSNKFKSDYYGLVAGFVETGETLEECVRREVLEETSLNIKNLKYFGSQAWPYPSGLMVGFTAEYESGELHLQYSELNKGGWFSKANMPAIPGKVSLARKLIDDWLDKH